MTTACTDHESAVGEYGIDNVNGLLTAAWYEFLDERTRSIAPTPAAIQQFAEVVRTVYVRQAAVPVVAEPVELAIEDATTNTIHGFLATPEADFSTAVLARFHRTLTVQFCQYRMEFPDGGVGMWTDSEG